MLIDFAPEGWGLGIALSSLILIPLALKVLRHRRRHPLVMIQNVRRWTGA